MFEHCSAGEFEGTFKNNYFYINGQFVSPFDGEEKLEKFFEDWKKIKELKENFQNEVSFVFAKEHEIEKICDQILISTLKNRVPLILSSKTHYINGEDTMIALR